LFDKGKSLHVFRAAVAQDGLFIWYVDRDPLLGLNIDGAISVEGFHFTGCGDKVLTEYVGGVNALWPLGTVQEAMMFREVTDELWLPIAKSSLSTLYVIGPFDHSIALEQTPGSGPYSLLYAHQDQTITGDRPFFFQDDTRTFFVIPRNVELPPGGWYGDDFLEPTACGWFRDFNAAFLFKEVDSNFVVETRIRVSGKTTDIPQRRFSVAGLFIRAPRNITAACQDSTWTPGGENWLFHNIGVGNPLGQPQFEAKNTVNSMGEPQLSPADTGWVELRITRIDSAFML
jgi:hypothetical protein